MNKDHRSDGDVCQRRRRRGAYAAVLSAAAGAALAAAIIPAPHASADTTDDAVDAAIRQSPEVIFNHDITTLDDDLGLKFLANPDVQFADSLLGLLPGGAGGTDAGEIETFLASDVLTPLIDAFGGGSSPIAAAAGDVVDAARQPVTELTILNNDITTFDDDLGLKFLANPDIQLTDSLLGLFPGGAGGTEAVEVETFAVNDLLTPWIDALGGGGGMMAF